MSKITFMCTECNYLTVEENFVSAYPSEIIKICPYCHKKTRAKAIKIELDQEEMFVDQEPLWETPSHLKYIGEDMLELALSMAKYDGLIDLEFLNEDYVKINIHLTYCDKKEKMDNLFTKLKNNEPLDLSDKSTFFTCDVNEDISLCPQAICSSYKCIFRVAGYLYYLIQNHKLEAYLKEREIFLKDNSVPTPYHNFTWTPPFQLRDVPENDFVTAKALYDNHLVHVYQNLENGEIAFDQFDFCYYQRSLNTVIYMDKIYNRKNDEDTFHVTHEIDSSSLKLNRNNCDQCHCQICPVLVAAYMQYLKNTGQEKIIQEERNKTALSTFSHHSPFHFSLDKATIDYLKGVSEADFKLALELQEKNYVSLHQKKTNDMYSIYIANKCLLESKKIPKPFKFDYVIKTAGDLKLANTVSEAAIIDYLKKTNQFDQFLAEKKKEDAAIIASLEWYEKKIPQISHVLSIAESHNVNLLRCIIQGEPKVGKSELATKIAHVLFKNNKTTSKNIAKYTLQQLSEIQTKHSDSGYTYTPLKKNQLYVLCGIQEFINDYKAYMSSSSTTYEYRKKSIEHVIKLLSSLSANTYVILEGTEKEIEALLSLNEKIKFLFSENRLIFENLTTQEIFQIFITSISDDLLCEYNADFYTRFQDYITYNDKYLPFKNKELGNYLAKYCNERHKLTLPPDYYHKKETKDLLSDIIGMENVKTKLTEFENYAKFIKKAKVNGLKVPSANFHMVFTGNSGTGKTTIARIVAEILFTYGLILENKLIEVERKDLVASYIGQTAVQTSNIIEKARGGVLFIDESYSLDGKSDKDFGHEAIATIIKAMEDYKDELVVIFAGYRDEMNDFINMNAGIASRIGYTFDFEDYTAEQLTKMYQHKMTHIGFEINQEILNQILEICSYYSKKRNFGNGRFVDKLVQETIINCANQNNNSNIKHLQKEQLPSIQDLVPNTSKSNESIEEQLNQLIGMSSIKKQIQQFTRYIEFYKLSKENNIQLPISSLHMLFTGNPGTGKTTVARMITEILFDLGFLYENKLTEVERKDLVAGYVGQTAIKTNEVIEKALGGVLFIDEAYSLDATNNDFSKEAIATLLKAMEDHKDNLVIIFAGYEQEMQNFVSLNPGIASRISYTFHFEDYTAQELTDIFQLKLQNTNLKIEENALLDVKKVMQYFCHVPNFGNGRFVDQLLQKAIMKHAEQCQQHQMFTITSDDIPEISEMIDSMAPSANLIKPNQMTEEVLQRIAFHEIGHAMIQKLFFPHSQIHKITINPEGNGALGYVEHQNIISPQPTRTELFHDIVVCMAGLASEEVMLGDFASGGSSDLRRATNMAKYMIMKLGMSENGFAVMETETKASLDEVNHLMKKAFNCAKEELLQRKDCILAIAEDLLKNKTIDEDTLSKHLNI